MTADTIDTCNIEYITRPGNFRWLSDVFFCGYFRTFQLRDCRAVAEMLAAVAPEWEGYSCLEGMISLQEGRLHDAIEHLEKYTEEHPENQMARYHLAEALKKSGSAEWRELAQGIVDQNDINYGKLAQALLGENPEWPDDDQIETEANSASFVGWQTAMLRA